MTGLICLPSPRPLLPSLLEAGFSHGIATAASKLYQQRAEEFKRRTETALSAAWQKIATLPAASASSPSLLTTKELSTFTEVYLRCLEEWREEMVQLLNQASNVPSKASSPKTYHSFNHEYLPLLEHFFEENPFPTHADKIFLAKKSGMQYKQIHVWFQNRRNRTKKEVKPLRKKPVSEGITKPLDKLWGHVKGYPVKLISPALEPSQSSLSRVNDEERITRSGIVEGVFTLPTPPHAYPSSYPPACAYDPFPCKGGTASFGRPGWRRVPCSKPRPVAIDIDDLVERFSQLSVRCNARIKGSPTSQSHAATAAITVIPSRAPHPSLIIPIYPKVVHAASHTSTRAPTSRLYTLGPSPSPTPIIPLLAPPHKSKPSAKWGIAPLPSRMQNTKRHLTPSGFSSSSSSDISSAGCESRSCSLSSVGSLSPTSQLPRSPSRSLFESPLYPWGFTDAVPVSS